MKLLILLLLTLNVNAKDLFTCSFDSILLKQKVIITMQHKSDDYYIKTSFGTKDTVILVKELRLDNILSYLDCNLEETCENKIYPTNKDDLFSNIIPKQISYLKYIYELTNNDFNFKKVKWAKTFVIGNPTKFGVPAVTEYFNNNNEVLFRYIYNIEVAKCIEN